MTASLGPNPVFQAFDSNGDPLSGGLLYTFAAGTDIPLATYTDYGGLTANTNPVQLDVSGIASVWYGNAAYKLVLKSATGATQWTKDNFIAPGGLVSDILSTLASTSDIAKGDALIGVKQPFLGSVGRTQHDKNAERVTPEDFGAVGDAVTDDTVAIQNWAASTQLCKRLPGKRYAVAGEIVFADGSDVEGCGESSIIDGTVLSFTGNFVVGSALGTLSALPALNVDVAKSALLYTFASDHGLAANDVFVIYNPTDYSWSGHRANYRAGEFVKVLNAPLTTTITPWNPAFDAYVKTAVDVYKLNGSKIVMRDFTVKAAGLIPAVAIRKSINPRLDNVRTGGTTAYAGVLFDKCYGINMSSSTSEINAAFASGDNYGLILSNCQNIRIQGDFRSTRHAISYGGDAEIGCVPCRDGHVYDSHLFGLTGGVAAAEAHGNSEYISYENCTIYNGAQYSGKNIYYRCCRIHGGDVGGAGNACCVTSAEAVGGDVVFDGCDFITHGVNTTRGILDFGQNNNTFSADTKEEVNIIIKNCTVRAPNATSSTNLVSVTNMGSLFPVNLYVDGIHILGGSAIGRIARLDVDAGADTAYCQVEGVVGLASGAYLALIVAGNTTTKWRMQSQSGVVTVTTAAAGDIATAVPQNFLWIYPEVPRAQVCRSGEGGVATGKIGSRYAQGIIYRVQASNITPGLASDGGTFGSVVNADLHWFVELREF